MLDIINKISLTVYKNVTDEFSASQAKLPTPPFTSQLALKMDHHKEKNYSLRQLNRKKIFREKCKDFKKAKQLAEIHVQTVRVYHHVVTVKWQNELCKHDKDSKLHLVAICVIDKESNFVDGSSLFAQAAKKEFLCSVPECFAWSQCSVETKIQIRKKCKNCISGYCLRTELWREDYESPFLLARKQPAIKEVKVSNCNICKIPGQHEHECRINYAVEKSTYKLMKAASREEGNSHTSIDLPIQEYINTNMTETITVAGTEVTNANCLELQQAELGSIQVPPNVEFPKIAAVGDPLTILELMGSNVATKVGVEENIFESVEIENSEDFNRECTLSLEQILESDIPTKTEADEATLKELTRNSTASCSILKGIFLHLRRI
jgi:hypothetical protein